METAVPDHPIIFSAPMIRALLEGRKTQTRRLALRRSPWADEPNFVPSPWQRVKPGDRLWVKERGWRSRYGKGDGFYAFVGNEQHERRHKMATYRPIPSIHMPRWASRLTLTVTATKIERLQKITNADAIAEGCGVNFDHPTPEKTREPFPAQRFKDLWINLHGADAWDANPEVVALTFTVERRNIDAEPK